MPRVSSSPEDAFHFKGSFADGWGEVIDAKALVFQFPPDKATGMQNPPGLFCELTIQRHKDGDGTKDVVPPETKLLSIQRASKDTGECDIVHPGKYPDGNTDGDPVDQTGALGAEGNTLFALQDGYQINDKTGWMRFTASLVEKGFKPAVLKRTYFPDLIGLRAYFRTLTEKRFRDDMTGDPTVFLVTEIKQFPYEKGTKKDADKTASARTASPKAPGVASTAATPLSSPNGAADSSVVESLALAVLRDTLAPAKKGASIPSPEPGAAFKRLKIEAYMAINKHKPPVPAEIKKAVQDQIADTDWLEAQGTLNGLFEVAEDGSISFPG